MQILFRAYYDVHGLAYTTLCIFIYIHYLAYYNEQKQKERRA